jgi:hypothetical protein
MKRASISLADGEQERRTRSTTSRGQNLTPCGMLNRETVMALGLSPSEFGMFGSRTRDDRAGAWQELPQLGGPLRETTEESLGGISKQ